ncbi:Crp/Fnr family transcriptional regulator [Prolixibacteraceae bacterium Z1-6]|uniref:Crp/Fnr family transcriptional regulator n=1 Tax=Draconibacterium aestuarii TaxID=2998507 RepID=A0A9X3FFP4_9BACT|nr:Crp/Fnr family transcriptional regulator [Prolixibacteraceae bacterium Z1-6]
MDEPRSDANKHEEYLNYLRKKIEVNSRISDSLWELTRNTLTLNSAPRNTILLEQGNYETSARFILKGVLKIIHHDTKSYIYDFRVKNDFLCDAYSLLGGSRTIYTFETVTKCEWLEINSTDLLLLSQANPEIMSSFLKRITEYSKKGDERAVFLRINNAEERYNEFCKTRPEVMKYTKLTDIASFLDITPQSLSRIRKK